METWKIKELQTIAQEIVDDANENGKKYDLFFHDAHNVYVDCCYDADYTPVEYYPDAGYVGGDLCRLELYNIDGCWVDEEGNETDLTDEEEQMLQDEVNRLIY